MTKKSTHIHKVTAAAKISRTKKERIPWYTLYNVTHKQCVRALVCVCIHLCAVIMCTKIISFHLNIVFIYTFFFFSFSKTFYLLLLLRSAVFLLMSLTKSMGRGWRQYQTKQNQIDTVFSMRWTQNANKYLSGISIILHCLRSVHFSLYVNSFVVCTFDKYSLLWRKIAKEYK